MVKETTETDRNDELSLNSAPFQQNFWTIARAGVKRLQVTF